MALCSIHVSQSGCSFQCYMYLAMLQWNSTKLISNLLGKLAIHDQLFKSSKCHLHFYKFWFHFSCVVDTLLLHGQTEKNCLMFGCLSARNKQQGETTFPNCAAK